MMFGSIVVLLRVVREYFQVEDRFTKPVVLVTGYVLVTYFWSCMFGHVATFEPIKI